MVTGCLAELGQDPEVRAGSVSKHLDSDALSVFDEPGGGGDARQRGVAGSQPRGVNGRLEPTDPSHHSLLHLSACSPSPSLPCTLKRGARMDGCMLAT